jgi:hypothetical protein
MLSYHFRYGLVVALSLLAQKKEGEHLLNEKFESLAKDTGVDFRKFDFHAETKVSVPVFEFAVAFAFALALTLTFATLRLRLCFESLGSQGQFVNLGSDLPVLKCSSQWSLGLYLACVEGDR